MSFAMTTEQIRARTKSVTRRFGWWFLKPGDELWAVEKAMGLQKGEKIERITLIEVVSARPESLDAITPDDCIKEGFPELTPEQFVDKLCGHYGCARNERVNRIEFKYLDYRYL
jgi:hypothetical protein